MTGPVPSTWQATFRRVGRLGLTSSTRRCITWTMVGLLLIAVLGVLLRGQILPGISDRLDAMSAQIIMSRGIALYRHAADMPPTPERTEVYRASAACFQRATTLSQQLVRRDSLTSTWQDGLVEDHKLLFVCRGCLPDP